jgi:serine/threonine-protein kinase OSR1/STK39
MEFPHDITKYQILGLIGEGSTCRVYSAICIENQLKLAIKVIDLDQCSVELEQFYQEVNFWSDLQHPNVIDYYGSFVHGSKLYMLMECLSAGSVSDLIKYTHEMNGFKSEEIISTILKNALLALDYLHKRELVHRDIKPGNILIGESGNVKLGDFGISTSLLEAGQKISRYTVAGTPCYMSPEMLQENGYQEKADIWSFGITAIELATGSTPYSNFHPLDVVVKILDAPPPTLPANFSDDFRDLVKKCLTHSINRRPSASDLLKHPFFKKAKSKDFLVENLIENHPSLRERFLKMIMMILSNPEKFTFSMTVYRA